MEKCYLNNEQSLFKKYARLVTLFARTDIGRDFLGVPKDIGLMLPNGYIRTDRKYCQATFTTRPVYAPKLYPALYKIDAVYEYLKAFGDLNKWYASFKEFQKLLVWNLDFKTKYVPALAGMMFNETTFYPDKDPESTSVSGAVLNEISENTWAVLHDATAGTSVVFSYGKSWIEAGSTSSKWRNMGRAFNLFDTSSLTVTATILSATTSVYVNGTADDLSPAGSVRLVTTTPASNTDLVVGDFDQIGTIAQSDVDTLLSNMTPNTDTTWTLNSTGLGNISKTAITKFGYTMTKDATNTAPTWASVKAQYLWAESAGSSSHKPKLVVTFTPAPSSGFASYLEV